MIKKYLLLVFVSGVGIGMQAPPRLIQPAPKIDLARPLSPDKPSPDKEDSEVEDIISKKPSPTLLNQVQPSPRMPQMSPPYSPSMRKKSTKTTILIKGISSSGKTTIVKELARRCGTPTVFFDDINAPDDQEALTKMCKIIKQKQKTCSCVCGDLPIDDPDTAQQVAAHFKKKDLVSVWIEVPFESLVTRVLKRKNEDDPRRLYAPLSAYLNTHTLVNGTPPGHHSRLSFKSVHDVFSDPALEPIFGCTERERDCLYELMCRKFFHVPNIADAKKDGTLGQLYRGDVHVCVKVSGSHHLLIENTFELHPP